MRLAVGCVCIRGFSKIKQSVCPGKENFPGRNNFRVVATTYRAEKKSECVIFLFMSLIATPPSSIMLSPFANKVR